MSNGLGQSISNSSAPVGRTVSAVVIIIEKLSNKRKAVNQPQGHLQLLYGSLIQRLVHVLCFSQIDELM